MQRAIAAPCTTMDGGYMMKRRGLDVREKRAAEVFSREKAEEKGLERGKNQIQTSFDINDTLSIMH
jgi:hypothetical protein